VASAQQNSRHPDAGRHEQGFIAAPSRVLDPHDVPEGERKTVTALFADIKGSTELMEDLEPEEARAIVDPALRLMIEAVHRYGGYIVQSSLVGGITVCFCLAFPHSPTDLPTKSLLDTYLLGCGLCRKFLARDRMECRVPQADDQCCRATVSANERSC
jgi:hypothetical protein